MMVSSPAVWAKVVLVLFIQHQLSCACPSASCTCKWKSGKQTVECISRGMSEIPLGIDPGTQVLDLSGNHLSVLVKERLLTLGLVNLQKIFLSRCHIAQIQDRAFARLTNLVELDLSENALTSIPASMFHDIPALMKISLAKNPIVTIESHTFVPLQYLSQLDLSDCIITNIKKSAFQGLKNLAWLHLNNNNLTTLDPTAAQLPSSLNELSLHGNNWVCDCHLRELRMWFSHHNIPMSVEPKCKAPKSLEEENIKYISKDELACGPTVQPLSSPFAEVPEGGNISLLCRANSMPEPEITWIYRGKIISNSSSYANFQQQQAPQLESNRLQEAGPQAMYSIQESASVGQTQKTSRLEILYLDEGTNGTFICRAENRAGVAEANFTLYIKVETPPEPKQETRPLTFEWQHYAAIGAALAFALIVLLSMICCLICTCRRQSSSKRARTKSDKASNSSLGSIDAKAEQQGQQQSMASQQRMQVMAGNKVVQLGNGSISTSVIDSYATASDLDSPSSVTYSAILGKPTSATASTSTSNPDLIPDTELKPNNLGMCTTIDRKFRRVTFHSPIPEEADFAADDTSCYEPLPGQSAMRTSHSFVTSSVGVPVMPHNNLFNNMQHHPDQRYAGQQFSTSSLKSIYDPRKFCTLPKQPRGGVRVGSAIGSGQQLEPLSLASGPQQQINQRVYSNYYANNGASTLARIHSNPLHLPPPPHGAAPVGPVAPTMVGYNMAPQGAANIVLNNAVIRAGGTHELSPGPDFVPLPPAEFCDLPPPPLMVSTSAASTSPPFNIGSQNDSSSSSSSLPTPVVVVPTEDEEDDASVSISVMSSSVAAQSSPPVSAAPTSVLKTRSALSKGIRKPPDGSAGTSSGTVKKVKIVLPPSTIVHESPDEGIVDCGPEGTEV